MSNYFDDFKNNGFCIIKNAIPKNLIELANNQIDAFKSGNLELLKTNDLLINGMLQRVINFHHSVSALKSIFIQAMEAGSKVCDMHGPATLYTSLFFEFGSEQGLHRDTPYFYSGTNGGYFGVWAALDDVDKNNGALIAIKESHKIDEPDLNEIKDLIYPNKSIPSICNNLFNEYNTRVINQAKKNKLDEIICEVQKGDVIIWHPSTLHGGLKHNDINRSRRSFVMHITPKDMPMMHMDYFFDRERPIPAIKREYIDLGNNRLIVKGTTVDFMHKRIFDLSEIGQY